MSLQAYDSVNEVLTPIAENDYKDSLEKVSALPTASADLLNMCYLLTNTQGSYVKGGIYRCESDGSGGYIWTLINGSGVPVDVVEDANMNAVTSNAVFDTTDALDTRVTTIENGLGTASAKDATDTVRTGSHDLVESNAVANAINQALSSIYVPRGSLTCAELTSSLLIEANVGNVYEMSDSGTTSALFIQGAGTTISVGDNVGIIKAGESTYMYNYMGNAFDLTDYQKKELTTPLTIGGSEQTTVEGALGELDTLLDTISNYTRVDNVDANSYVKTGVYYLGTGCSNVPCTYLLLQVISKNSATDGNPVQIGFDIVNNGMYIRNRANNTWKNWQKLVTESELGRYQTTTTSTTTNGLGKAIKDNLGSTGSYLISIVGASSVSHLDLIACYRDGGYNVVKIASNAMDLASSSSITSNDIPFTTTVLSETSWIVTATKIGAF